MKKIIRKFALWLEKVTTTWVIPKYVWQKLDNKDLSVSYDLDTCIDKWGNCDPAIIRANMILRRLRFYYQNKET